MSKKAFLFPGQGSQSVGMLTAYAGLPGVEGVRAQAAAALEEQAAQLSNITYTAPTEDGGVSQVADTGLLGEAPVPKVGRNDPCPCGSGKKYKQCHGRLG